MKRVALTLACAAVGAFLFMGGCRQRIYEYREVGGGYRECVSRWHPLAVRVASRALYDSFWNSTLFDGEVLVQEISTGGVVLFSSDSIQADREAEIERVRAGLR